MPDSVEAIYRILSARAMSAGEQRLPMPPEKFARLDQLAVGQQVQGRVLEIVNGKATVLIGNQQVRMELPVKAAVGDTFQLVFAGQHPRPTFVLAETGRDAKNARGSETAHVPGRVLSMEANGEAVVLIGDRIMRMPLPACTRAGDAFRLVFANPAAAADVPANVSTHISDAGQLLGAAAKIALDPNSPAQASSPVPLLSERPGSSAALALALRLALARTGLFYESHLFEWSNGNYPLASLLHEPQGSRSEPALLREHLQPGAAAPPPSGEAELLQLIAQQLQLLENQSLVWRGEVWPRQTMRWEIARQPAEHGSEAAPQWKTRISLDMPRLGRLVADMFLDGQGRLEVRLSGTENALPLIEPRRAEAVSRLAAAGCRVSNFTVVQHGRQ